MQTVFKKITTEHSRLDPFINALFNEPNFLFFFILPKYTKNSLFHYIFRDQGCPYIF